MDLKLKVALAQINTLVGDFEANADKIRQYYSLAKEKNIDLLVFGELTVCGYPPEDLLEKPSFLAANKICVEQLAAQCPDITMMLGFAELSDNRRYNSMAICQNGKIVKIYRKALLPNYGVFDEKRYFSAGQEPAAIKINGLNVICTICEDIWDGKWLAGFVGNIKKRDLLINISASPFHAGKIEQRLEILQDCAKKINCPIGYCNIIGGQDELVFDGRSIFVDAEGNSVACGKAFEQDLVVAEFDNGKVTGCCDCDINSDRITEIYQALVLGTKDYVCKNGFKKVLIGISGGIDSALTAAIAVDALGAENVIGITMPTRFNSTETIGDSEKLAKAMGIEFYNVPIGDILNSFDSELKNVNGWDDKGLAYENLQARIRGTLLMSLSNQFGAMVLTTGNKSETAVGYSTMYGDTAGGFAVIKDVLKTDVYRLCNFINKIKQKEFIPKSIIDRIPSAELRPNQKDSDSLPDYDLLDAILVGYVEQCKSAKKLVAEGFDSQTVLRVIKMVDRNEYKRRQCPPGIKITPKAFGKDRRMPITNSYKQRL